MNIEMIENLDAIPNSKKHTVTRGQYLKIIKELLDSDMPALVIHCDSIEDAVKKNVGLYNAKTSHSIDVKVWRNGSDVFVKKGDTVNGNKDL